MNLHVLNIIAFLVFFLGIAIVNPAFSGVLEDSAHQTNEFIAVGIMIVAFMFGAQLGHTR